MHRKSTILFEKLVIKKNDFSFVLGVELVGRRRKECTGDRKCHKKFA